jgi:zinc protease
VRCFLFVFAFVSSQAFAADVVPAPLSSANFEEQMRSALQVEKFQLDNGLTVLLHQDMSVPVVAYHQWFRVGSADEKVGRTGLAHFFEHLMFKGTPSMSGREYELAIHSNGGSNNAFTTRDYTGYYTFLPSDKLELAIKIESDRMRNLLFDQKEINSEREVVKEERRMRYENDVFGAMNELLYTTVYKTSEYRWPVIGYMADLNATSLDELKSFYNTYYAPNNAVVVVAGAFDKEKAKKMIMKHYGSLKSQPIPVTKYTPEAEQKATRRAKLTKPVQNLTYSMTFISPPAGHVDNYALDLLANVLGEGTSSRLYKSVIYQSQLASSIGSYNSNSKQSGIFSISASAKPKVSAQTIENKIKAELDKIKKDLVSKKEFEKVQNQVLMSYVSSLKTIGGKARALALNEVYFNDYSVMFKDLAEYNKVTLQDIKRVANKYLDMKKASVVIVEPSGVLK